MGSPKDYFKLFLQALLLTRRFETCWIGHFQL